MKFSLCSLVSEYGVRRDAWNTSCIFHWKGNCSLYTVLPNTFFIRNGPSHFGWSFRDSYGSHKFCASSQMSSPCLKGENVCGLCLVMSCHASSCAASASCWTLISSVSLLSLSGALIRWNDVGIPFGSVPYII